MALLWLAVLAVLAGSSSARPNRIVGGEQTSIENYPSIVQVENYNPIGDFWVFGCGGNILNTRYILSAAHCFEGLFYQPSWRRIRAGSTYANTGGVIHSVEATDHRNTIDTLATLVLEQITFDAVSMYSVVEAVYNHPSYNHNINFNWDGDITVVRLATPLVYSSVIQPTRIVAQNSTVPDNSPVVHAGWGVTEEDSDYEFHCDVLRHVQIYTINNKLCADRYSEIGRPYMVTENMICNGILDVGGKSSCQGDSGGPLYYGDIVIGIVSWAYGCARANYPGVSTKVASYTDWIVSVAV